MTATPPTPWSRLLQRLDPTEPINLGTTDKGASINRAFDAQMQRAIWDKRYELKAHDHRMAYRVFSKWENTLIAQLKDKGVVRGPEFITLEQQGSPLHTGATAMQDRKTGRSLLRTYDLGPDLDVWNRLRPCIQGAAKPHVLYRASDLLRLARATLLALKDFHDHGFVHCDLHAGNVALPCKITNQAPDKSPQGPSLTVQPLWDELRIFDLDASLSQHSTPPVVPFLSTDPARIPRMSNHLRLRLCMLHALAESKGEDAYDEPFWARHLGNGGRDLQCMQRVDWREDLHQLGHLFKGLLENDIEYDHPNQEFLLDELATEWTDWGAPEQLDGLKASDLQKQPKESQSAYYERLRQWVERIEKLPTPAKPHDGYLARLDAILVKHAGVGSGVWVFRRDDNDQLYAATKHTADAPNRESGDHTVASSADTLSPKVSNSGAESDWKKWVGYGKTAIAFPLVLLIGGGTVLLLLSTVYQLLYKGLWQEVFAPHWRQWTQGVAEPSDKRPALPTTIAQGTPIGRWDDQPSSSVLVLGKPLAQPFSENLSGPPMLAIPPTGPTGFLMGSPSSEKERGDDESSHSVVIRYPLALSQTEITRQQYQACVIAKACAETRNQTHTWELRDQSPVVNIAWNDAQRYVEWLNALAGTVQKDPTGRNVHPYRYRLPSEAEWEYAARAGTQTPFGFVNGKNIHPKAASYDWRYSYEGSSTRWGGILYLNLRNDQPQVVGSYAANAWGLVDMHGNVAEWVQDCYQKDYQKVPNDGRAHGMAASVCERVNRGGAWDRYPHQLRSAARFSLSSDMGFSHVGFRVARTLAPLSDVAH